MLQTNRAHASLARGIPPAGLLSPAEQARWAGLKTAKRRRDWLIGRWTAKRLAQARIGELCGVRPPLDALTIASEPDGAPALHLDDQAAHCRLAATVERLGLCLSISHSGDRALCALSGEPSDAVAPVAVGCDIERIEARDPLFVTDYFTEDEIAHLHAAPPEARDTLVTAIWSAKEATLKAVRLGLSVDTCTVSCVPAWPPRPNEWMPCALDVSPALGESATGSFVGWWRVEDGYVLTLAARYSGTTAACDQPQSAQITQKGGVEGEALHEITSFGSNGTA